MPTPVRTEPTGPRTEPLDPSHAVRALEDAGDREQIFELLLRAARSRTRFAALISVHEDQLRGRRALAEDGLDPAGAGALQIPRGAVPALEAAIASREPAVAPLATGEPFLDGLLEQLGGAPPAALILPVAPGAQTVALIVAHRGDAPLAAADVADLLPLAAASSAALARVLAAPTRAATEGYEIEVSHGLEPHELEALYAARGDWEPLVTLLLDRAAREGDTGALEAAARVYEDELGDAHAALLVWLAVIRREPEGTRALDQLDRLARAAGAWDEVLAEHAALAEELEAAHPDAAARVWHLVGRWHRDHAADPGAAARALDRAVRANPDDLDALTELIELLREGGRWTELIALLARRAEAAPDGARRAELYAELGELYETRLAQPADAIACYERALDGAPDPAPVLVALHRLYLETEAWEALGELLPRLVEALGPAAPPAVIVELYVELGTVLADHLGRPDDAVRAFRDALALDPKHAAAHRGLARVYEADRPDRGAARRHRGRGRRRAARRSAPPLRRYRRGVARAGARSIARPRAGRSCSRSIRAASPRTQGLARALRADEQWPELVAAQRALPRARSSSRPTRIELLLELADVLEDRLDDLDGAIAAYHEVTRASTRTTAARSTRSPGSTIAPGAGSPRSPCCSGCSSRPPPTSAARADLLQRIGHVQLARATPRTPRLSLRAGDRARSRQRGRARGPGPRPPAAGRAGRRRRGAACARRSSSADPRDTMRLPRRRRVALPPPPRRHRARARLPAPHPRARSRARRRQAGARRAARTTPAQWEDLWPHLEQEVAARVRRSGAAAEGAAATSTSAPRGAPSSSASSRPRSSSTTSRASSTPTAGDAARPRRRAVPQQGARGRRRRVPDDRRAARAGARPRASSSGCTAGSRRSTPSSASRRRRRRSTARCSISIRATARRSRTSSSSHLARGRYDDAIASLRALAAALPPAERARRPRADRRPLSRQAREPRARDVDVPRGARARRGEPPHAAAPARSAVEAGQWKAAVETIDRFLEHETDPRAARRVPPRVRRDPPHRAPGPARRARVLRDRARRAAARGAAAPRRARALDVFGTLARAARRRPELEVPRAGVPPDDQAPAEGRSGAGAAVARARRDLPHRASSTRRARSRRSRSRTRSIPTSRRSARASSPSSTRGSARKRPEQVARARRASSSRSIRRTPTSYRALGRTALEAGRIDEAWCVGRALVFLKQATPEEERAVPPLPGARGRARRPASSTRTRGHTCATPTRTA